MSADSLFWFSILAIFLITIVSAMLRRLTKDRVLRLLHGYHVAFFSEARHTLWGDCLVSAQGIELRFDKPMTGRRQLTKSSALLYEDEFGPMICLTRSVHGLHPPELAARQAQIRRTFNPNIFRRGKRRFQNILNTMRDAISKTLSLAIGRLTAGGGGVGAVISTQAGDINTLAGNVVGLAANAYEPLLEHYIGKPVILEIVPAAIPGAPGSVPQLVELPGYLVDYTQKFIALFNLDHTPLETLDIRVAPGAAPAPDVPDLKITLTEHDMLVECRGEDVFVLWKICCGSEYSDLGIAMIPGTSLRLPPLTAAATITVERTRQVDLVVPRTRARVRFGADPKAPENQRHHWRGIAPVLDLHRRARSIKELLSKESSASPAKYIHPGKHVRSPG